ncbi:Ig-like domain-containing protein, partial [Roseivirga thermotolerans]
MKAVYCKLRLALLILFICSISKELVAQNPIIISNSYVMEVEGGVEVQAFGVFLANPISVTIGGCDCVPVPGKSNNPNFITCFVSQSCGDVSGQMTVVTPTGQGTNGPIFTLDFPEVIRSMPYMVVDEETVPDSLIHQIRIKALGDEENLRIERGYFEWSVATPLPSPLPTTRFSSRSTNNESSQVPFDYTDEQFQSAMDEIEYHVRVDSTLLDDVTADGISKKRKRTYFTLAAEFPTPQYPGYFGLGLTWGENIDNLSHSPTMTVDADFDVVASGEVYSMNLYSANFYEVFGLEHEQSYEQTGLLKYLPNFLFTMDQINGPFPTAHFANISFHNPGGVTDYLEGRTLEIATPQVYKKYMGTTVVDETISSNFYLKNLTDSILDYESIEVVFSGDDASSFSVTQQPATDVAVGAQSLFTVSFTPTSSEPRQEATLTINTDDKSYYSFPIIGFVAPDVTVEITSSLSPSTQEATIPIQIQFSEEVTGFEASDLAVVNASVSDFATQDNVTFTANLTPIAEGDITVNVPEASAVNQSNFSNKAASEFSIKYDLTAPEVTTVTLEDSPAKDAQEITYKVMFSEAVQNITLDDFQVDLIEGFAEGIVTQAEKVNETEVLVKVTVIGSLYNKADQVIRLGISQDHNIADLAGHRLLDFDPTQIPTHTTNLTEDETSGTLNLILEDDDVPSVSPFRLNTLSLSVLIPNLGQYYPHGNPVKLVAELDSLSPNISYYTGNENLVYESELKLSVYVLNTDTDAFEKAVDISGTVNITAGADDVALDSLGYTMSSIKFNNLKASNSTIGNINTIILGFKLNLASAGLVSAINKRWEKLRYPLSPVRVNEVKYKEDDSEEIEFIELYDGGLGNVTFKNVLVDILEKSGPFNFQIPMTTNDEGYYVLGSSNTPNASSTALDSLNFYGGTIYFWTQQFKFSYEFDIDRLENMFQVELGEQYSYGRFPQDVATTRNNNSGFYYGLPTPGKPNTIFLVPDTLKLSENSTTLDIDAFGGDASDREAGVTYTLTGGADQSLFNIDESTGVLSFLAAPDFENPTDSDSDNEYLVEVTASRAAPINDSDVRLFKVEVLDVDEIAPSLTITSSVNEFTNREFTATFTFSEDVSGFELEDISVTNGTASDFATVSADVYTATISPSAEGLVTVAVAANVAADLAGNLNTAATSISITHDQTAPQVLSVRLEDSPGKESQEITYRVSFSEAIDSLTLDDFQMDLVSGFAEGIITQAVPQENNEVLVKATIIGSLYNQADQVLRLGISPDNNLVDKAGNALMEYNNETIPTYTTNLTNDNTAGTLNLVLNDEDIPEGSPFRLNTASLGLLIPQLAGAYPNANPVQLHFTLRDFNPNESIYSGSENLANESSFTMDFLVEQGDGSFTQVLTVDGEIDFVFSISEVSDAELAYSMSSLNLKNLEASNSSIGLVNAFLLTFKLNLAEVGLVTAINNSGFRELRYPRTPVKINEIKLKNDGSGEIEFLELYDGGIGNVSNLKLTTFSSYVDIVTDENGYFVLGTSATPNVSNPFFDDHKVVIKNTFSLIFGEGVIDHPLGQGVALEIERLSGLDDLVFNNNFSLQRFPQNEAVRDNATQFFSGMPTPGKPNTIFLVPDTLKLSENSTTLDIDAFGGDASDREAGVTYTITGGADQSLFNIDESTGVLSFLAAPDFENPTDSDSDNEYLVEVTASRAAPINDSDVRLFKVEVLDVDEIAPSLTITSSVNEFTNREFTATFTFSEDVSGFELEDISVTNGTASDFATVSADVYTATISPSAEGLVTVAVSANVAADLAGNLNTAATSISVTNDQTAPTLVSATKGSGTQIILTFSEKVKIDEADANNFIVENVNNNQLCVLSLEDGTAEDNQLILGFDDLSSAHIKLTITYNPSIGDIRDLAGNSLAADATGVEVALNEAPTVTDVEITGDLIVGQTLTGTYTFTDGNSDPESGSTYQWYMADDANGNNKAAISGATSATYVLTSDHVGKYFSFEVTPSDGHVFGTAQESSLQGPVSKIAQSITFNALEAKTYGDEDFELTATASSNLTVTYTSSNTNVATVSGSTVSIIGVGETTITASQAGNDSYLAATNATQTLTIEKATLTATADDKSKTYGEENPALTISYTGFVNGDDETAITQPTASTTADAGSDAGTYAITLSGGAADNYSLTTVNGTLTIGKATLTARADDKERAVGQENPEFTISYTGFVNGDDKSEI